MNEKNFFLLLEILKDKYETEVLQGSKSKFLAGETTFPSFEYTVTLGVQS